VATGLFTAARWIAGEVQRYMGQLDPRVTLAIYTHITAEDLPHYPPWRQRSLRIRVIPLGLSTT
jgi:hypothetical protein